METVYTEHHPGFDITKTTAEKIADIIPEPLLSAFCDALYVGNKENDSLKLYWNHPIEYYNNHMDEHIDQVRRLGRVWDEDGHHNYAAVMVRCVQAMAKDIMPDSGG